MLVYSQKICTRVHTYLRGETMEEYREQKEYILPKKVLAVHGTRDAEQLLTYHSDISSFKCTTPCVIAPAGYVIFDFGKEYQGGAKVIAQDMCGHKNATIRLRFGESAMECCSEIGEKDSTNDHSVRDEVLNLPWVGCLEYGMTGFRFLRIDNLDKVDISLIQVLGVSVHSGKKIRGVFRCNDELINSVWNASAYTMYLNNNKYITDGIKRDRLVWIGDMHPETISVLRLFGNDPSIRRSLDYIRDLTVLPEWMNDIPSYSMWWVKIHLDLFRYTGDRDYLADQLDYLHGLCSQLVRCVNEDGSDTIRFKFIDWPTSDQPAAQNLGIRSLIHIALCSCREIFQILGDSTLDWEIEKALACLDSRPFEWVSNKQAISLAVFADLLSAKQAEKKILSVRPLQNLSCFLGYYVLQARARAGNMEGALNIVRDYYGAMLRLGATTMWEDFDLEWVKGAKPIDVLLQKGEYDVHGDNGGYCYRGYRHSLCHGWSAGTVPFASEYILGLKVKEAGCREILIEPMLGSLSWAEGTLPTPYGDVNVRAEKKKDKLRIDYEAPQGVKISVNQ